MTGLDDTLDRIQLRDVQRDLVETTLARHEAGERLTIGLLAPGAGKSLAALATWVYGYRREHWRYMVHLTPRTALCHQSEVDARQVWMPRFAQPRPKPLLHRSNSETLTPRGCHAYTTTYQSVVADPDHHLKWARQHQGEFLLVVDEAQALGAGQDDTRAAEVVRALQAEAAHMLVLTGTPYRSDGQWLVGMDDYYVPDGPGRVRLDAHVSFQYQDGVAAGVLRPLQADLIDGETTWTETLSDGTRQTYTLPVSALDQDVSKALKDERVWKPIVDRTLSRLDQVREDVHEDHQALLACLDQSHARRVVAYARSVAPHLRIKLAVSDDGADAREALRETRRGIVDVLVTVRLAYVGFSAPPITVIGMLGNYRFQGFLEQLVGRGLRVWDAVPLEQQVCYLVAPADPLMRRFVAVMREHSDRGQAQAGPKDDTADVDAFAGVGRMVELDEVDLRDGDTYGADRDGQGDLTADQAERMRHYMASEGIVGVSESNAARMLRGLGLDLDEVLAKYAQDEPAGGRYDGMTLAEARRAANGEARALFTRALKGRGVRGPAFTDGIRSAYSRLNAKQGVRRSADLSWEHLEDRVDLAADIAQAL